MSSLNRTLILVAMAIQALIVCSDIMQPVEPERAFSRDMEPERAVPGQQPSPRSPAPFVACYEQEVR
jgi:hypothetical protein